MTAEDALERLYGVPPEDFVTLRGALAAELRASGDAAGARDVLAAKKPSRTSWALNQVARHHPDTLRAALEAHGAASLAQSRADGDVVRDRARAFRDRLADVIRHCAETLAAAGANLTPSQARKLGETLRAAISEPGESRQQLLTGRLVDDVEDDNPFAGAVEGVRERPKGGRASSKPPAAAKARHAEVDRAREALRAKDTRDRAIAEARRKIESLEAEAREAREAAREAELTASRARAEADRARRLATTAEERLTSARDELNKL